MKKLLRKIKKKSHLGFFLELNHDYKNTIFLSAVGRSGTTWVTNLINYNNDYRYIHEPFHPGKIKKVRHYKYIQYIRPENRDLQFIIPTQDILSGRIRNSWTDSDNTTIISRKRLIKDIRTNLLLKWLHVNFPKMPIILLFRHPCAVVNSWLKLGWGIEDRGTKKDVDICLSQKELVEDFLVPFHNKIKSIKTSFEEHIFFWCMQYYVPLRQFKRGEIHFAFYENFCVNPEQEIRRLFTFLGKNFDKNSMDKLKQPSSVTREESAIMKGESLINAWRQHIGEIELERALEILNMFGLDSIYSKDSMPDVNAAYSLLSQNLH